MKQKSIILIIIFITLGLGITYISKQQDSPSEPKAAKIPAGVTTQKSTFMVEGMTCSGCETTISNAIKKLTGIYDCKVDHNTGEVTVLYDPKETTLREVGNTLSEIGYTAKLPEQKGTLKVLNYSIKVK